MADEEQFSLCWNNFNSNLSAGFHESLCKGDLVDVTLAAEGQLVKAHRLVLSVCSPYFRKMFTQMPSNQHAFVFLKDVSHAALKDLIQFMYCGEVNVKQDALPTFISTAEALQIKGLTETGEPTTPTQTPTPASQSPLKAPTPIPTSHNIMTSSSPRSRIHHQQQQQQQQQHQQQRNQNRGSYKAESESETDDKVITSTPAGSSSTIQMVSQKRVLQRSLTPQTSSGGGSAATVAKRPKIITTTSTSSGDPLESGGETIIAQPQTTSSTTTTHIITTISDPKNVSDEPEFIELPIETIPTTKSEPDYGDEEESGEVETVDQDATYVEDDSYGDMKYDESYFTENDDAKPGASGGTGGGGGGGFSDTYTDQSVTEAQGKFKVIQEEKIIDSVGNQHIKSIVSIIPSIWEQNGTFWWPPGTHYTKSHIKKFTLDDQCSPNYTTWTPFMCKVKKLCNTYEEAESEMTKMLESTDTEEKKAGEQPETLNNSDKYVLVNSDILSTLNHTMSIMHKQMEAFRLEQNRIFSTLHNSAELVSINQTNVQPIIQPVIPPIQPPIQTAAGQLIAQVVTQPDQNNFSFKPISNEQELIEIEDRIASDTNYRTKLLNYLVASHGSKGTFSGGGETVIIRLLYKMFTLDFLLLCSWSGCSRTKDIPTKICIKVRENILSVLYEATKLADPHISEHAMSIKIKTRLSHTKQEVDKSKSKSTREYHSKRKPTRAELEERRRFTET